MQNKYSFLEALLYGWSTFRQYLWVFVGATAIVLIVRAILNFADKLNLDPILAILVLTVASIIDLGIQLGYVKLALNACQNQSPKVVDLISGIPFLGKFVLALALCFLIGAAYLFIAVLLAGKQVLMNEAMLTLTLLPLLLVFVRFIFFPFVMVTENLGPLASLSASLRLTQGRYFEVLLLLVLFLLINMLGALCLVIGLLVTLPVTSITLAWYYLKISGKLAGNN